MKNRKVNLLALLILLLLLFSCGENKLVKMREEVKNFAIEYDSFFEEKTELATQFKTQIEDSYASVNWDEIDISTMDESKGGEYYSTGFGTQYSRKVDDNGPEKASIATWGNKPLDDMTKKQLIWLDTSIEPITITNFEEMGDNKITITMLFDNRQSLLFLPGTDHLSLLPWPQDFTNTAWYGFFKSFQEPGIFRPAIGYFEGINQSIISQLVLDGTPGGVFIMYYSLPDLLKNFMDSTESLILAVYEEDETTEVIYGITKKAMDEFKIDAMTEYDYIERFKETGKLERPPEYILSHESQPEGVRNLAALIKKENISQEELSISINNINYHVAIEYAPVTSFYFIGLLKQ